MTALNALPPAFHPLGWQLPAIVFLWIALAGAVMLAAGVLYRRHGDTGLYGNDLLDFGSIMGIAIGIGALLFGAGIDLGYLTICGPQYMHDYRVEGTVVSVTDKLADGSGDLTYSGTPVVTLDSVDVPLQVDDPKALTLLGKDVTLVCSIGWNYRAHDDYYCRIIDFERVMQ